MKGKPKIGVVYASAGMPINPPVCLPARIYAKKYFLSLKQIKLLLAKKQICGVKFRRRLFIADIPPNG